MWQAIKKRRITPALNIIEIMPHHYEVHQGPNRIWHGNAHCKWDAFILAAKEEHLRPLTDDEV